MINLIKNELIKIFSKKSLYIILAIIFVIIFFQYINKNNIEETNELDNAIESAVTQKNNTNTTSYNGLLEYIELDTKYDILEEIKEKYGNTSWQAYVILNQSDYDAYDYYHDYFLLKNQEEENSYRSENPIEITIIEKQAKEKYETINKIFKNNDWKEFARFQEKIYETNKASYDEKENKDEIKELEIKSEKINIRLSENIAFGYTYLNDAVETYGRSKYSIYINESKKETSYHYQVNYQKSLEELEKSKYIISSKEDIIGNENQSRNRIANAFNTQQLFIILLILYFSATLISEEINAGTIKQLLIKPHSRMKILISKLITAILMTVFSIIAILVIVIISNIVLCDTNSLKIPMALYNFNTNNLMIMNLGKYLLIQFCGKLPLFIGICLIAFALSTIIENSVIATIIPCGIYIYSILFGNNISGGAFETVPTNAFLLTRNWDITKVLFGRLNEDYKIFTLNYQVLICLAYFIAIIIATFVIFQIKDIKNK